MTVVKFAPYRVTIHPGNNFQASCDKLARYIIDRWMPGNAGGVHFMLTPKLSKSLLPLYEKANKLNKSIEIGIVLNGNMPAIVEIDSLR